MGEEEAKLSTYVLVRMTPEMKKRLEDKVYWDRVKIPVLLRSWIEEYTSTPSENEK